jgi:hypothetical protein
MVQYIAFIRRSGYFLIQAITLKLTYIIILGSHVFLRHKMSARKYREKYDLEVKRGVTPPWFRQLKGRQAIENDLDLS